MDRARAFPTYRGLRPLRNRGYLWTRTVDQRGGSCVAVWAAQRDLSPNHITLGNLAFGLLASAAALALIRNGLPVAAGVTALVGWQLAYVFDCADGQLARATGTGSTEGALLDVYCDFFVQGGVITVTAWRGVEILPETIQAPAVGIAGVLFLSGPYMATLKSIKGVQAAAQGPGSRLIETARLVRDYGLQVAVFAIAIAISADVAAGVLLLVLAQQLGWAAFQILRLAKAGSSKRTG